MTDLDLHLPAFDDALRALPTPAPDVAHDEAFWRAVAGLYDVQREPVNLEHGYWGVAAEPVLAVYRHWTERVNRENTLLIRRDWPLLLQALHERVARLLGCGADEVVLTRGASEAMLPLITGYNRLQPGDTVLYSDLDYPMMRHAMAWLGERRGVQPVSFTLPEPATREAVIEAYKHVLQQHPRTRLVLLTHLSHSTGLVLPVREIAALARAAGADVILDAAHSLGQIEFDLAALDVPFVAFNLHKWIGAPLGCGCLVIRRERLADIDPWFGSQEAPADDIRARVYTGSPNFAAWLTLPAALALHERIGTRAKALRLRSLRDQWVREARALPGVQVLTPDEPGAVGGITAFRLQGRTSTADNEALVRTLLDEHGVHTVRRGGPGGGDCVRVTPALPTTRAEIDRFAGALRALAR